MHAAAREISYTPNQAARSLVTGRSDSVAFLVDETEERMFSDPFFLGMLRGAQVAIAGAGMQLVFTMTSRREDHERFVPYAAGRARRRGPADVAARRGPSCRSAREATASRPC